MDSILAVAFLLAELCISQSITTDPTTPAFVYPNTCAANCELAGDTVPPPSFSSRGDISATTPTASYIVFTAYSITSSYSSNGVCVVTVGSSITVSPRYSVPRPASIPASVFLPTAVTSFIDHLGFSACSARGEDVPAVTLISFLSLTGSPLSANTTSTESPTPSTRTLTPGNSTEAPVLTSRHHRLDNGTKVGIGIAIPVAAIALILLTLLLWRRSRKIEKAKAMNAEHITSDDTQPYLQQKAELEAEEKRRHELEAKDRRYELSGESRIHELPEDSHDMPSFCVRQELRSEEHSRELEVP